MKYTYNKEKKLKSKKSIEALFLHGKSVMQHPVRMIYRENEHNENNKAAVSVPKRKFKHAVDRNLLKRQMREAYRLNQFKIEDLRNLDMIFIYQSSKKVDYQLIQNSIEKLLLQIKPSKDLPLNEYTSKE